MLKVLGATLLIIAVRAQDCNHPQGTKAVFGQYLQCIKENLDQDYQTYEDEMRQHSRRAATACFASSIEEGNKKDRCVLTETDINQEAWGRHGPLRDCSICRTFATGAIKAIKSTPAEDQKCIRAEIGKAIAREANFCLQKKISSFPGVPDIPDLEEKSFDFKESVISSLSDHILIQSRLSFCGERKPARSAATRNCLRNPFVGYLGEHCKIVSSCDQRLAVGSCASKIPEARNAVCTCIHESQTDLKQRISSISTVFNDLITKSGQPIIGDKISFCVSQVKKQMITPVNDWTQVIDSALSTCIKKQPAGQSLGMESMLNVGCRKVLADTTGQAKDQLRIGFDFVNNLIDAMVERSGRFCGGEHCLQR